MLKKLFSDTVQADEGKIPKVSRNLIGLASRCFSFSPGFSPVLLVLLVVGALHKKCLCTLIHTWLQPGDDLIASGWKPFKRFPRWFLQYRHLAKAKCE